MYSFFPVRILWEKVPCRVPNVIIGEGRHCEIAVVVALLEPDSYSTALAILRGGLLEVFW